MNKTWFQAAGVRALKTAAQVAITTLPTTAFTLGEINWVIVGSTAVGAAILSLLTSLAGIPEVDGGASPFSLKEGE